MITTLESMIAAEIGWTWRDHVDTAPIVDSNRHQFTASLGDGAAAGQADAVWHVEDQSLAAGGALTFELDLLEQPLFGDIITIPLARVKAILIVNKGAGPGYLQVGGAAAAPWYAPFGAPGDTVKVMPGSPLLLAHVGEGWEVMFDRRALRVAAVGGPVTFDMAVLGVLPGSSSSSS